jgi:hypothetical protein
LSLAFTSLTWQDKSIKQVGSTSNTSTHILTSIPILILTLTLTHRVMCTRTRTRTRTPINKLLLRVILLQ